MKKSKIFIVLLAVGIIVFGTIQLGIFKVNNAREEKYTKNQSDASTHDITAIEDYRTSYMGDATNVTKLFSVLPLNDLPKTFEINSDTRSLTVNYSDSIGGVGEERIKKNMVYNSIAAMSAIDNLSEITYNFSDNSYFFDRGKIKRILGNPLSELLDKEIWDNQVQSKLNSNDFIRQFFD